ncbi:DUF4010 domain-containing protein [Rhizobium sp. NZLR1b]|nr:DUF4010 domain-containing protein [Rhizobium sp. NZLR1b]MBX5186247.1 DUF4010 domain-containing protein [Rhizobium sp. NZLR5]MBX5191912.1 DUF4010 domain-containing protein [Rhizobium sp. NZLR3b]MBX5198528.1 DUF4010 domain-containing protein [Rhizobium sp. NZLR10]
MRVGFQVLAAGVHETDNRAGFYRRSDDTPDFSPSNPLELVVVLRFALLLAVVTVVTRVALTVFGTHSLFAVAFITGLGDLDAITLSVAKLSSLRVPADAAAQAIAAAASANLFAKFALAASTGSIGFAGRLAVATVGAMVAGVAGLLLT